MKILVGCEFSGRVRDAFNEMGHDAWSCDFKDSERGGKHIKGDIFVALKDHWDLLIAFPPCTHLAVSGAWLFEEKKRLQDDALKFVADLMNCRVKRIAIENPVGVISTRIRKPDQIIEPYQFGHNERKKTCLWLKNLPLLKPTLESLGRHSSVHAESPGARRADNRSRTYPGVALAMARQWGDWKYPTGDKYTAVVSPPVLGVGRKKCPSCKCPWNEMVCDNCGYS